MKKMLYVIWEIHFHLSKQSKIIGGVLMKSRHNGIRTHLIILKIINYRLEYVFIFFGLFPRVNVKINPRNYQ